MVTQAFETWWNALIKNNFSQEGPRAVSVTQSHQLGNFTAPELSRLRFPYFNQELADGLQDAVTHYFQINNIGDRLRMFLKS